MGFSHFHGSFSNPSPFKGEVRRGMGYICRCSIKPNDAKKPDNTDMGKPFGKASTCLRVAASAKAEANLCTKWHAPSFNKLELTKSEILRSHKES